MNAPVRHCFTTDELLENAIRACADLQSAMHQAGNSNAYNVFTMVTMLKGMRTPETIEKLEAERLERARAGA
jgi:hypothetical protein